MGKLQAGYIDTFFFFFLNPVVLLWFSCVPVWLDLLNAFKLTTSVPTSNHNLFCCCSSLYHSLVLSERGGKEHEKSTENNTYNILLETIFYHTG